MILKYILTFVFIFDCLFLILVVLLQSGKGGDVAAAFGGSGSQTAFGPRGAQKPLEKATIVAAVIFMLLAMVFSLPGALQPSSVVHENGATTQPTPAASPSPASGAAAPAASPAHSPSPAATPAASPEKK
ncbi:MAG: preprotein translocase subunit SecG [Blastocatellia bacterium]|nr:preprotein translocase subunit SecG [Blastocatellia bacterium]